MFALLDAIVTGNEEFGAFPPQHTISALVRRGLLEEREIPSDDMAARLLRVSGHVRIIATDAGRRVIADAEVGCLANPIRCTEPTEADHAL